MAQDKPLSAKIPILMAVVAAGSPQTSSQIGQSLHRSGCHLSAAALGMNLKRYANSGVIGRRMILIGGWRRKYLYFANKRTPTTLSYLMNGTRDGDGAQTTSNLVKDLAESGLASLVGGAGEVVQEKLPGPPIIKHAIMTGAGVALVHVGNTKEGIGRAASVIGHSLLALKGQAVAQHLLASSKGVPASSVGLTIIRDQAPYSFQAPDSRIGQPLLTSQALVPGYCPHCPHCSPQIVF